MVVLVGPSAFFEDPVMAVLRALRRREVRSRRAEELPGVCASGRGSPSSGSPVELRRWDGLLSPAPPAAPRLWLGASPRGREDEFPFKQRTRHLIRIQPDFQRLHWSVLIDLCESDRYLQLRFQRSCLLTGHAV